MSVLKKKGFTLIELLVVISIITLLSTIILAALKTGRDKAKNAIHEQNLVQLRTALELYKIDNGTYPNTHYGGSPGHFFTPDPRYAGGVVSDVAYFEEWIPGLVSGGYISSLPGYANDGKGMYSSNWFSANPGGCASRSATYFYAADLYSYKVIVACPEGGVREDHPFKDNSDEVNGTGREALMICFTDPNRPPGSGDPCGQGW